MEPLLPIPLTLPAAGCRTLVREIYRQMREAVADGRLAPGYRLPSTRAFAQVSGVSRNSVVAVYELLKLEGYATSRGGSGTRIVGRRSSVERRVSHGSAPQSAPPQPMPYAFQLGVPDTRLFPFEAWRRLSNRALRAFRRAPAALMREPQGRAALRSAIANHVSFTRAVSCAADDVIVTAGAQQAFGLLARLLVKPGGTTVALEDPGYPPLRVAFETAGASIAPVPVDAEGLIVDRVPHRSRVVCVTPSHQFPLGSVLSARRRAELLDFAQLRDAVLIEDDYDGEFRFDGRPLDSLQTLDRAETVFYVGTFSKSLLPDLRLGYIVAPRWAMPELVAAKAASDGFGSSLTQDTLAALIEEGSLARHVRKMQAVYAKRRSTLLEGIRRDLGAWLDAIPSAAGLHVAAVGKRPLDDVALVRDAQQRGVRLHALSPFYRRRPARCGLIFGYGAIDAADIGPGLKRLRSAFPGKRASGSLALAPV